MNFEKVGHNFAKIKSKSNNKKQDDIQIYLSSPEQEDEVEQIVPKIEIPTDEKDLIIQHLPFKDKIKGNSRQILYISGQSGSGKSYYTKSYVEEYIKLYPNNLIFLFSVLEEDETLDAIKKIKRVKLNDDFYNTMFSIDDFKNCFIHKKTFLERKRGFGDESHQFIYTHLRRSPPISLINQEIST